MKALITIGMQSVVEALGPNFELASIAACADEVVE